MQRFETRFTGKITSINVSGIQRTDCRNVMQQPEIMSLMCLHQPSTILQRSNLNHTYHKATGYNINQALISVWLLVRSFLAFHKPTATVYLKEGNKRLGLFADIACHDNLIILCNILVIISKEEIKFHLEAKPTAIKQVKF